MPILEIAVCSHAGFFGSAQVGDILEAREPVNYIGQSPLERKGVVWMIVDTDLSAEQLKGTPIQSTGNKRRFSVDFDRMPDVNNARAFDPDDEYQPFINPHPVTGAFRLNRRPSRVVARDRDNNGRDVDVEKKRGIERVKPNQRN